jgi:hypothetical protein
MELPFPCEPEILDAITDAPEPDDLRARAREIGSVQLSKYSARISPVNGHVIDHFA